MQVDALGRDDVQAGKTMKRAMSFLAAVAVAAAAGLATIEVPEVKLAPHVLKTDAREQGVRATAPAETLSAPSPGTMDPALQRVDEYGAAHG